ncbi:Hypothetical predicted protein [Cloeon dipterum]|uniref:Uncharacterized protein n=1 Tax=Cloeon dipterum TaxID=197152 RepID=A0A8S1E120_9INSE|nr:Hypothetical predicted protein [Cloeon dipterum]
MFRRRIRGNIEKTSGCTSPIDQEFILQNAVNRVVQLRNSLNKFQATEKSTEDEIIQTLRSEICSSIICAVDTVKSRCEQLDVDKKRFDDVLDTWLALQTLRLEYEVLFKRISSGQSWDTADIYTFPDYVLQELVQFEEQLAFKIRMTKLRTEHLEKIKPHLGAKWPKLAENAAINDYVRLLKFQISSINQATKTFEIDIKRLEKMEKANAKKFWKLKQFDRFGNCSLLSCWRRKTQLTSSNLHVWHYSLGLTMPAQGDEVVSTLQTKEEEDAGKAAIKCFRQLWSYEGDPDCWRLPGQMIRLVHHLSDVEQRLLESQARVEELERVEQQMRKIRNEKNLLHHELARNRKFLTQVLLEKLVTDNLTLKQFLMNSKFPQSEDPVVQQLVLKNATLEQQVQVLEEVVKFSREEATRHKERSCNIANSLNNAINSLEQIAVMFILHERTDQQLIFKLKSVVQNERLQNLFGLLNKDDLMVLQDYLQKGNVEQVLSELMEELHQQQSAFRDIMQQLGPEGLAVAISSLAPAQLIALEEAVADERLDTTTELLRGAKRDQVDQNPAEQVELIVRRLLEILHRLQ